MRELTKEVEIDFGDKQMTFVIKKMDAFSGAYLLKFVTEKLLPAVTEVREALSAKDGENLDDESDFVNQRVQNIMPMISKFLESISEEELIKLEKNCLKTVMAKYPAGLQEVINGDSFCVPELEYDVANTLFLCYQVIEFNTKGFFEGKHLGSLLSKANSSLPSA